MAKVSFGFLVFLFVAFMVAIYNTARIVESQSKEDTDFQFISSFSSRRGQANRKQRKQQQIVQEKPRLFHTVVTSSSSVYENWQCRIMYYWYKRFRNEPGSEMGGFTRILHAGEPDDLMDELPTVVVDQLPPGVDKGYVVLNRPWAFVQWLEKVHIDEDYIFMAEPDHLITKPVRNLASMERPAAFPFFYITPKKYAPIIEKFAQVQVANVDPIGNSPVIIHKAQLQKIARTWHNMSLRMKNDAETDKALGWVLEMYAYAIASAAHGVQHSLHEGFMIQPPWDTELGERFLIHYTYGCDYTKQGVLTYGKVGEWRFDKRGYTMEAPPRNLSLPPSGVPQSVVTLIEMINEATENIPNWGAT